MNFETNPESMYYGWSCGENTLRPIINQTIRNMRKKASREEQCDIIYCWNCFKPMRSCDGIPAHWRKKPQKICPECYDRLWNKGARYIGRDADGI